eukprot:6886224-Lingulodinium_polyedra.AAC.1
MDARNVQGQRAGEATHGQENNRADGRVSRPHPRGTTGRPRSGSAPGPRPTHSRRWGPRPTA